MFRLVAAIVLALAGPATAQPGADPASASYVPPPCDHLYQVYFARGSTELSERAEAIAEVFAGGHARLGTQVKIIAWLDAGRGWRNSLALARHRIAIVHRVLARFDIAPSRIEVAFRAAAEAPHERDAINLSEIIPPSETERRRAAYPPNIAC